MLYCQHLPGPGIGAGAPAGEDVGMAPGEGQAQLLQEREWDRHNSKQVGQNETQA
jgi:hypothetical protein